MSSAHRLSIALTNLSHEECAVLEGLTIIWPRTNRRLQGIAINGSKIFETKTAWSPRGLSISNWSGCRTLRLLAPGEKATLSFDFEVTASTDLATYDLRLDFGNGYLKEAS